MSACKPQTMAQSDDQCVSAPGAFKISRKDLICLQTVEVDALPDKTYSQTT